MRQDIWTQYPLGELTELRVHGAGATPIEELLDSSTYVRVAGDDTAGFYRVPASDRPEGLDTQDPRYAAFNLSYEPSPGPGPDATEPDGVVNGEVEAYYWGKLSSGGGWRAFWILLLPFALINLAGWNAPRFASFTQRLVRLLGLVASVALVYWITAISIGVINECGPGSLCAERNWYLGITKIPWFEQQPSRLAVVGLVLGVLTTFALWWWPGRRSADRYERYTPRVRAESDQAIRRNQLSADGAALWYSERTTKKLAAAHVLAMLGSIAAGCFVAVKGAERTDEIFSGSDYFMAYPNELLPIVMSVVCLAAVAASAVYVFVLNPLTEVNPIENRRQRRKRDPGVPAFVFGLILVMAGGFWIWTAGVAGETSSETRVALASLSRAYRQYANTGFFLIAVSIIAISAALLIARTIDLLRPSKDTGRYGMRGYGPALLPLTALVIMAAMVSGAILFIADVFGEPDYQIPDIESIALYRTQAATEIDRLANLQLGDSVDIYELAQLQVSVDAIGRYQDLQSELGQPLIRLGREYYLMPLAFVAIVILLLAIAVSIVLAARARIPWKHLFSQSRIDRPIVSEVSKKRGDDQADRTALAKSIVAGLRKPYRNRRMHALLALPAVLAFVFLVAILIEGDWVAAKASGFDILLRPAVWMTVGVFTALAIVIRNHYNGGSSRGTLGGVWDIVTFWPRFYHPFAPPSYAVRSVPEIAERIRGLSGDDDDPDTDGSEPNNGRVLLSAHSQGVPTTLAALSLITDSDRRNRIALLTYGSPTGMLYARFFPDYFDRELLTIIGESLDSRTMRHLTGYTPEPERTGVRWTNLWRLTDWTGGYALGPSRDTYFPLLPYFASASEVDSDGAPLYVQEAPPLTAEIGEYRLADPEPVSVAAITSTDPLPAPTGHGDYLHDKLYPNFRQILVDALYEVPSDRLVPIVGADSRGIVQEELADDPPDES